MVSRFDRSLASSSVNEAIAQEPLKEMKGDKNMLEIG